MHCRRNALRGRERTRKALKRRRPHSAAPSPWSSWTENPGRKIWRSEREDDRQQKDKSIMRIQFSFGFVTFPSPSSFAFPNRRSRLSLLFDVVRNQDILGQRSSSSPFSEWRTKENNNNKKKLNTRFFCGRSLVSSAVWPPASICGPPRRLARNPWNWTATKANEMWRNNSPIPNNRRWRASSWWHIIIRRGTAHSVRRQMIRSTWRIASWNLWNGR